MFASQSHFVSNGLVLVGLGCWPIKALPAYNIIWSGNKFLTGVDKKEQGAAESKVLGGGIWTRGGVGGGAGGGGEGGADRSGTGDRLIKRPRESRAGGTIGVLSETPVVTGTSSVSESSSKVL